MRGGGQVSEDGGSGAHETWVPVYVGPLDPPSERCPAPGLCDQTTGATIMSLHTVVYIADRTWCGHPGHLAGHYTVDGYDGLYIGPVPKAGLAVLHCFIGFLHQWAGSVQRIDCCLGSAQVVDTITRHQL